MKMNEYYAGSDVSVLLIPPMLASADQMKRCLADKWEGKFHCLIPDISGNGVDCGHDYHNAAEEAALIHDYLITHNITKIHLAYAASMGGGIMYELIRYDDVVYDILFFEGSSFFENAPKAEVIVGKIFMGMRRFAAHRQKLAAQIISKMYGKENGLLMAEHLVQMSNESITNIMHDFCHVKLPVLTPDQQKKCTFAYGEKDFDKKPCVRIQPDRYPDASVRIWEKCGHCQKPILDADNYARMLSEL